MLNTMNPAPTVPVPTPQKQQPGHMPPKPEQNPKTGPTPLPPKSKP